jgi:pimeloyl-ACP methyl ester carboxylesterase
MSDSLPILLIPGLLASPRLYTGQIPDLWRLGPVTIADHTRDDSISAIARRILSTAPPRFALCGLSMGGYISFEIMRVAPERVVKLALLDTSARPDLPEQSQLRRSQIAEARNGGLLDVVERLFPTWVHPARRGDDSLEVLCLSMAKDVGAEAFERQQLANIGRIDSRPTLAAIRCPTLVLVGEQDALTPPERAAEIANAIPNSRLVTVPDCGHMSAAEQPQKVTEALVEFLRLSLEAQGLP